MISARVKEVYLTLKELVGLCAVSCLLLGCVVLLPLAVALQWVRRKLHRRLPPPPKAAT